MGDAAIIVPMGSRQLTTFLFWRYTQLVMALLTLNKLGMRVGVRWILRDVTLEVGAGEIVGVFGRSDSGKSTLARLIAGLNEPTSGSVEMGELDGLAHTAVSVASSAPAFAPEFTVYENLEMFASIWQVPRKKRAKEITFLIELLRLGDQRGARAETLSSGALRRLELARAMVADAPLLVIDSLLDTLDQDLFEKVWEHLLKLRRDEMKSVLVLTSVGKLAGMCARIVVLHRGRVGYIGGPDDFRRIAGDDMIVLGDMDNPTTRNRISERFSVIISEDDGFLSFRVGNGERMVGDLLAEFGSELSCVYLKRPTLDDALNVIHGGAAVATDTTERRTS